MDYSDLNRYLQFINNHVHKSPEGKQESKKLDAETRQ